jgi:hypothetical protein
MTVRQRLAADGAALCHAVNINLMSFDFPARKTNNCRSLA